MPSLFLLVQVYVNGQGPFRTIVDTGAASFTLRPAIAERIGAVPRSRIERVTLSGAAFRPASPVTVQAIAARDEVEMVFSPINHPAADGVLGQNWLRRHVYFLDVRNYYFDLDPTVPPPASVFPSTISTVGPPLPRRSMTNPTASCSIPAPRP